MSDTAKKRNYAEDRLQAQIVTYLRLVLKDAIVFSIPNGGYRKPKEAAKLRWTGQLNGVPDLAIVAKGGQIYFIEVKTATGVLSEAQQAISHWCTVNGVRRMTARRLEDVQAALINWGIGTREASPQSRIGVMAE